MDGRKWLQFAPFAAAVTGSAVLLAESAPGSSPVDDIKVNTSLDVVCTDFDWQPVRPSQYASYSDITEFLMPSFSAIRRKHGLSTPSPVRLNVMNRPQIGSSIDVGFKVSVTWKATSAPLRTLADMYCSQTGCVVTSETEKAVYAKSSTRECRSLASQMACLLSGHVFFGADSVTWARPKADTASVTWDAPQGLTHSETTALLECLDYVCRQFATEVGEGLCDVGHLMVTGVGCHAGRSCCREFT
jgi:hypothetical protein